MRTEKIQSCNCPNCNVPLDAVTDPSEQNKLPSPGDVTLCLYCDELLEFTDDMMLQPINIKELAPEVQDAVVMMLIEVQAAREGRTLH